METMLHAALNYVLVGIFLAALKFFFGRSRTSVAKPSTSPKRATPSATSGKRPVQNGLVENVETIDNTAPAAIASLVTELVHSKEYTREDLRELERTKLWNPELQEITLSSRKRSRILGNLSILETAWSGVVQSNLVHKVDPHDEHEQGKCMVSLEDDPAILRAMKGHLSKFKHYSAWEKETEAKEFIKHHFYINWTSFYKRNKADFDAAMGHPLSGRSIALEQHAESPKMMLLVVDKLREDSNANAVRHQDTILQLNTDNNKTVLKLSADHKESLGTLREDSNANAIRNQDTVLQLSSDYKDSIALLSDSHERVFKALTEALAHKHDQSATPTKRPKPKTSTERKARRAPSQAMIIPMTPATAKKTKATRLVKRVLIDGAFPLNKSGGECGHCQRTWNKFSFCSTHEHLLEEITEIVQD